MSKNKSFWDDDATPVSPKQSNSFWEDDATEASPDVSYLETLFRGGAQGGSLGFADEITAGLESAFTDKTYKQALAESRANYKAAEEANPATYMAGDIGGSIATGFIPGLGAIKGATTAARLGKAAGMMGAQGAVAGIGRSEAEDIGELAQDAAIGGVTGAAFGAVGQGLGEAVGKLPSLNKLGKMAAGKSDEYLYDATGAMKADNRALLHEAGGDIAKQKQLRQQIGRQIRESANPGPFSNAEDILSMTQKSRRGIDEQIGGVLSDIDSGNASKVAELKDHLNWLYQQKEELILQGKQSAKLAEVDELIQDVEANLGMMTFDRHKAGTNLRDVAKDYSSLPDYDTAGGNLHRHADRYDAMERFIPLSEGNRLKSTYGRATGSMSEDNFTRELRERGYTKIRKQMEDSVGQGQMSKEMLGVTGDTSDAISSGAISRQKFQDLNRQSHLLKTAEDAASNRALSQQSNLGIGLRDVGFGAAGSVGGLPGVVGGIALSKGLKEYGSSIASYGLDKLSKTIQSEPGRLGKFAKPLMEAAKKGNKSLAATDFVLSQRDPEYREMKKKLDGENDKN